MFGLGHAKVTAAAVLIFGMAQPTAAQQAEVYAANVLNTFEQHCGLILENPQSYLDSALPNKVEGLPNSTRTEDEQILTVASDAGDFVAAATIGAIGGTYLVSCELIDYSGRGGPDVTAELLASALKAELDKKGWPTIGGRHYDTTTGNDAPFGVAGYLFLSKMNTGRHEAVVTIEILDSSLLVLFENEVHQPK